jgi:hypothetical protein
VRARLAAVLISFVVSLAAVGPATAAPIEIGHIPECTELVPAAISIPPQSQTRLDVRVLLDGVSQARGEQVLATAASSYAPLGITLAPSFQSVSFSGTDADGLNQQAKNLFGGQRPAGVDVVYTLTSKDIVALGQSAVAGLADCIGGVAFPANAFAVGENFTEDDASLLGLTALSRNLSAKVAAHEIGHLMGGHHHYANCAEGIPSELGSEASPCTLMFNDVGLASLNFATLNGVVVRGHGELYAAP